MTKIEADEFGPKYSLKVYDHKLGLEGILVIDNTVLGPGKGGIRMTPDVSEEEVLRLARAMTWKNALAGIPYGGAKAGIVWKGGSEEKKKALVQAFAKAFEKFIPEEYIAGPDVNTGEKEMQWFVEATENCDSATGKPASLCNDLFGISNKAGFPHELGSTGFGVAQSTKAAVESMGLEMNGLTVSIHGFGNVGTFTYKFLSEMGAKVIAIADKEGALLAKNGFDPKIMDKIIKEGKSITEYSGEAEKISDKDFWSLKVDVLIPASVTDVINEDNKEVINAQLIVEGGNIPMRENTEDELFKKGIMFVPDFVANAGGVISSSAELQGYSKEKMFEIIEERIVKTTKEVINESIKTHLNPRAVALSLAKKVITQAQKEA